ncbi:MAG: hypothetical protein LBF28_03330 [Rickettsiales bacterium]|jgi:hypothetical protein|nr:hypothetical protein [Rickettsiales bacterium]
MRDSIVAEICNEALAEAGQHNYITSLDEYSPTAHLLRTFWDSTLKEIYSDFPSSFKTVERDAELVEAGQNEYGFYIFAYPADALNLIGMYGSNIARKLNMREPTTSVFADKNTGEKKIRSKSDKLLIVYIQQPTENDLLTPTFRSALKFLIAAKVSNANGGSAEKYKTLMQMYKKYKDDADINSLSAESEPENAIYGQSYADERNI